MFYRYADLLGTYAFRLTRSREYTEEIVQDVFLKIWMSREVLAEIENLDALHSTASSKMRRRLAQQCIEQGVDALHSSAQRFNVFLKT